MANTQERHRKRYQNVCKFLSRSLEDNRRASSGRLAKLLETETAGEAMRAAYADVADGGGHEYNLGNLVCLGKKPAGNDSIEGDLRLKEQDRKQLSTATMYRRECSPSPLVGTPGRLGRQGATRILERPLHTVYLRT